jgi:uncharacterized protein YcbK (DUF882 family)
VRGIDNRVPINALSIRRLYLMAARFEEVRACLGGRKLVITSGYRCKELNAIIPGAAEKSRHRQLLALDVRPQMSAKKALLLVQELPTITYAYRNSFRSIHIEWVDLFEL